MAVTQLAKIVKSKIGDTNSSNKMMFTQFLNSLKVHFYDLHTVGLKLTYVELKLISRKN